jgi:hypothetical protein
MHDKNGNANQIFKWLNYEWKRHNVNCPFSCDSMPLVSPKSEYCLSFLLHNIKTAGHSSLLSISSLIPVPCQRNGYDCGVYVCRYAYGLYVTTHLLFTWCDYTEDPPFNILITKSNAFKFFKSDIKGIRGEMSTLIDNLSELYLPMLEKQEKADREGITNVDKNNKPNKGHGNDNFYVSVSEDYIHKLIRFYLLNGLDRWMCTSCRC